MSAPDRSAASDGEGMPTEREWLEGLPEDRDAARIREPLNALDDQARYRMLCEFEKLDLDVGSAVFVDRFPPFAVVEIDRSVYERLGRPTEIRVLLEVVSRGDE